MQAHAKLQECLDARAAGERDYGQVPDSPALMQLQSGLSALKTATAEASK